MCPSQGLDSQPWRIGMRLSSTELPGQARCCCLNTSLPVCFPSLFVAEKTLNTATFSCLFGRKLRLDQKVLSSLTFFSGIQKAPASYVCVLTQPSSLFSPKQWRGRDTLSPAAPSPWACMSPRCSSWGCRRPEAPTLLKGFMSVHSPSTEFSGEVRASESQCGLGDLQPQGPLTLSKTGMNFRAGEVSY